MQRDGLPIVVGFDGSVRSQSAVAWAINEARSVRLPVRLLTAYEVHPDYPWLLAYPEVSWREGPARRYVPVAAIPVRSDLALTAIVTDPWAGS